VDAERKPRLPIGVMAVALFEFARGGFMLLVSLGLWPSPQLAVLSTSVMQVVTLNAAFFYIPHNEDPDRLPFAEDPAVVRSDRIIRSLVVAPLAVLSVYIGFSMLLRKPRGAMLAVVWSAMTVLYWLRGLLVSWGFGETKRLYFTSPQTKQSILMALGLNVLIALYLTYGEGPSEFFTPKKQPLAPFLDVN